MKKTEVSKEDKEKTEKKFEEFDKLVKENKPFFYKLKEDPSLFAYYFFRTPKCKPFKIYPFQDILLNDMYKRILLAIARQTGKSTSAGIIALFAALWNNQYTVVVVSATKPQAIEFIKKIKDLMKSSESYIFRTAIKKDRESKSEITLKNYKANTESRIISVPATDAARGYTADLVIVDEAAFIEQGDYIFKQVVEPMTQATDGRTILLSTPNGKSGFFWECYNADEYWHVYQFDWTANPNTPLAKMEEKAARMTKMEFKSEYEAQFVASKAAYFNPEDIHACASKDAGLGVKGERIVVGVDFGKIKNNAVIMMGKIDRFKNDYVITVLERRVKPLGTNYAGIIGELKDIHKKMKPALFVLDASGVGEAPSDVMREFGAIVEPIKFSIQRKADLFSNLKIHLEQKKLKIPKFKELIDQLELFEYEYTESGNIKLHAPEGGHDDECDALALMVWGLSRKYTPVSATIVLPKKEKSKKGKNLVYNEKKKDYEWK